MGAYIFSGKEAPDVAVEAVVAVVPQDHHHSRRHLSSAGNRAKIRTASTAVGGGENATLLTMNDGVVQ